MGVFAVKENCHEGTETRRREKKLFLCVSVTLWLKLSWQRVTNHRHEHLCYGADSTFVTSTDSAVILYMFYNPTHKTTKRDAIKQKTTPALRLI